MTTCSKCRATSGNDWSQCKGSCPMPGSPHHDAEANFGANIAKRKTRKKPVRESQVEEDHRLDTKAHGGIEYKFTSPGRRAVPDRLRLMPIPPEHREIVARYITFREYKRPGEQPTPAQHKEHEYLRSLGFTVDVINERLK